MKNLTKNFIAFTLSEMMIVLLILSVISAATLPSITQRSEVKPRKTSSKWVFDKRYNKGYFYQTGSNSASTDVVIGFDISDATAAQKAALQTANKNAALRLVRPSYILSKVYYGRSSIAFFDSNGAYQGGIGNDASRNLTIGKDVVKDAQTTTNLNSIYIGQEAAKRVKNYHSGTTVIGYRAASVDPNYGAYSTLGSSSVVIGSNIFGSAIGERNVILGAYATSTTDTTNPSPTKHIDTVAIGAYSMYEPTYSTSVVNVGYFAGSETTGGYFNNTINLGAYAGSKTSYVGGDYPGVNIGYKSGANIEYLYGNAVNVGSFASYDSYANGINIGYYANYANRRIGSGDIPINIGAYAGAKPDTYSFDDVINIGAFAGYASDSNGDINIGYHAGSDDSGQPYPNIRIGRFAGAASNSQHVHTYAVMIGDYAGYGVDYSPNSVLIGRYAGYSSYISSGGFVIVGCYGLTNISGAKKMCIGGIYPGSKGPFSSNGPVSTMITPYYSSAMWTKTEIFLLAKNVVSYGGTLTQFSDKALKENIVKTKYGIDKLRQVNIYQYNFKGEKDTKIGVIAQELQNIYPKAVSKASNGYLSVNSDWILFSMVQALKDVDNAVLGLQKELNINIRYIKNLSVKLCSIEKKLDRLSKNNQTNKKLLAEIDVILSKMERK